VNEPTIEDQLTFSEADERAAEALARDEVAYQRAVGVVEETLAQVRAGSEDERRALEGDVAALGDMSEKLERGRVDIAVFGEISTGKSSLVNALVGRRVAEVNAPGGTTRRAARFDWDLGYRVPGFDESSVVILDTPGINEVAGAERERMAHEVARRADLVLFVTDSDLNDLEFEYLSLLHAARKPVVLVFNKADQYTAADRRRLHEVLHERTRGLIRPEDIVETRANPLEREYVIERPDGSHVSEWRTPPPDVARLKERMLAILDDEGKALIAINSALFAHDTDARLVEARLRLRDANAERLILRYAVIKGVAVAANPIPVADIAGGLAVDITMVMNLAAAYGLKVTRANAATLVRSIAASAGWVTAAEVGTHLVINAINVASFGLAIAVTALPQGVAAAFSSYIVGHAAKRYFEQGRTVATDPGGVVRDILATTDTASILSLLRERILASLRGGRPTSSRRAAP
jgi:GTPase